MKETKLEEGEACNDSAVDPDIALSYIDEKLQDVLGHFQKDFEDGVSSENLGSKFGGYGSFLPTYQRSRSWTSTRTPPEAFNNNVSISPNNLRPEGGRRPSLASSPTSLSGRPLALKAPAANGKTNPDEDSTSKSEIVKKPTNFSDKKALKLQNRVGIENLSTQKKAEIYSGLGLDVSPSSSLDDSPMNNGDLKDSQYESPTSILQIMTSYPMHDGLLLSPLSDDLICLTEKGKLLGRCVSERTILENLETSVALVNLTHYAKSGPEDVKKNHVKVRYRDFFGDIKTEDVETQEIHSPEMLKVSDAIGNKSLVEHNSSIKERVNVGKTEKPCSSGEYPILASNGSASIDDLHASQENPNLGVQAIDSSGKTRYESKASSSGTKQDGSQSSTYVMMNHSSGMKNAKMRNISEVELDASSKKIKRDDAHDDENWTFCSSSGLSHNMSGKIRDKYKNRDLEDDTKKDLVSAKNPEGHISDVSMHKGKSDNKDSSTKRKGNELRDSSSRCKEKNRAPKSDSDQHKNKNPDILNLSSDQVSLEEEKTAPGKSKSQEKSAVGSDRLKKSSKKDPSGKSLDKNVKGDNQSRIGHHDDAEVRSDVKRQAALPDRDDQRSSKKLVYNKSEQIEVSSKSPLTIDQNETVVFKEPVPGSETENGANLVTVVASEREKSSASRQGKKAKSHHGNLPNSTANKFRDLDVPSHVWKDSSSQAATNAIKDATNLKHLADRLKNSGSSESIGIYFQAALKFLHGASLLELDSSKHGEVNQAMRIYSSTAKLCLPHLWDYTGFCGHEYEKLKDMAAAALAYKCMEVAYMRVIYSSQSDANRYRNELQTALQIFPPGESPFSSVSDVDNLNNPTIVDKAATAKVVGSLQVVGTQVVSARNGSSFMRLINLAQEVNFAMEASRKSRVAFAAANPGPGDSQLSIKKALDFNFQDVDGLLRLVRVAMEAISH
ncbi:hypothetical protein RND71_031001 [Anisodus tanguticus]|uniref:CWZF3/5/7 THD domain-containing protein n=1 Tax=Anisodus tanguticus TaxID=243964 RepID=A0AAE1RHG2_9SOLA|nr:hypothetical protein RND71_031001 [Anisodus tanguticus]